MLIAWVKDQRSLKKLLDRGELSNKGMSADSPGSVDDFEVEKIVRQGRGKHKGEYLVRRPGAPPAQLCPARAAPAVHDADERWLPVRSPDCGRGTHGVQVKWRGYADSDNTWEPADHLKDNTAFVAFLGEQQDTQDEEIGGRGASRDDDGGSWQAQLARLEVYKRKYGDSNVPQKWAEDPKLGQWVSNQRTGKKLLDRGKPCRGMTAERATKLEALGFGWAASGSGSAGSVSTAEKRRRLAKREEEEESEEEESAEEQE